MAVQMLTTWRGLEAGSVQTLDSAQEGRLIDAGLARAAPPLFPYFGNSFLRVTEAGARLLRGAPCTLLAVWARGSGSLTVRDGIGGAIVVQGEVTDPIAQRFTVPSDALWLAVGCHVDFTGTGEVTCMVRN